MHKSRTQLCRDSVGQAVGVDRSAVAMNDVSDLGISQQPPNLQQNQQPAEHGRERFQLHCVHEQSSLSSHADDAR